MSIFEAAHRPYGAATRVAALLRAAAAVLRDRPAGWAADRRARRSARLLYEFSDTELKDIGLARSDLGRIAQDPAGSRCPAISAD